MNSGTNVILDASEFTRDNDVGRLLLGVMVWNFVGSSQSVFQAWTLSIHHVLPRLVKITRT